MVVGGSSFHRKQAIKTESYCEIRITNREMNSRLSYTNRTSVTPIVTYSYIIMLIKRLKMEYYNYN